MQNIHQLLATLDIVIPEGQIKDFDKAIFKNYKTIAEHELSKADLEKQRDDLKTTLDSFEGIDPANIKVELEKAQKAVKDGQEAHAAELAKRDQRAETGKFLAAHKFINDETKEYYMDKLDKALDDEANKGKNRQDIFDGFTKDEKGETRTGVFVDENPNKVVLPSVGGVPAGVTADQFKKMGYKERAELYTADPAAYNTLKET